MRYGIIPIVLKTTKEAIALVFQLQKYKVCDILK